jgi:hypothetical protein
MLNKIPFAAKGAFWLLTSFLYFYLILDNKVDFLFHSFLVYPIAIVLAWFFSGFMYGLLAGRKAIEETKRVINDNTSYQPGASTPAQRAKGYWIMTGIFVIFYVGFTIWKHIEISGL